MVFVDPLTIMLVAVAASASLIAIYLISQALGKKIAEELAMPGFFIGVFDFLSGFFMSFSWPLPGAYNILFGDPMLFLGIIMLAGSYMLYKKISLRYMPILGFLLGIYLLVETYGIATLNLESGKYFMPAFSFYLFSTISALLSPIASLDPKKYKYAYHFLAALLILTALLAMFIGCGGIYEHLASPP
ncbi:MAG: DUF981 family protein [Candidatus Micrarchaeia archaeon]|jgi:putative membrane protein